jgi:hypothetical protein
MITWNKAKISSYSYLDDTATFRQILSYFCVLYEAITVISDPESNIVACVNQKTEC